MTAEVLVMNRSAVALGADSKVTIGGEKTYDTVNKIFTLSKIHPVGVMIFGNADFMRYPWELICQRIPRVPKGQIQTYSVGLVPRFLSVCATLWLN